MSMYIGKDNSGTGVVHITRGSSSEDSMKSGILNNTVFYTKYPLSSYKIIPITESSYYPYGSFGDYVSGFNYVPTITVLMGFDHKYAPVATRVPLLGCQSYSISSEDLSALASAMNTIGNRILMLDSSNKIVGGVGVGNIMSGTYDGKYFSSYGSFAGNIFGIAHFQHESNIPVSKILILYDNYYPFYTGPITINSSGIYVGNVDIFASKSIVTGDENSGGINVTPGINLVTTAAPYSSGLRIESNSSGTKIIYGGKELFNSSYHSYLPGMGVEFNTTANVGIGINGPSTLFYTFKENENYITIGYANEYTGKYTYVLLTKGSTSKILLNVDFTHAPNNGGLRANFEYFYVIGNLVYYQSIVRGGSYPNSTVLRSFKVEVF